MTQAGEVRRVGIIMAGGSGERFWPLSRRLKPKQLLKLTSHSQTMLEEAIARIVPLTGPEHIYVATGEHLVEPIRKANSGIPDENVIAEPCKRNTAGCLAYATAHLMAKYGEDTPVSVAVLTADPFVGDAECFRNTIEAVLDVVENEPVLGTIGIVPSRPETGYGYIEVPEDETSARVSAKGVKVHPALAFHEKPELERAREYCETGRYLWNGGMFFWTIETFLAELDQADAAFAKATRAMATAMQQGDDAKVRTVFEALENTPIDCALMERTKNGVVARAEFDWDDMGSWPALARTFGADAEGNVAVGDAVLLDSAGCVVYNDISEQGETCTVAVLGAEDLVVVATRDGILVAPKDRGQDIKRIVASLQERGTNQV